MNLCRKAAVLCHPVTMKSKYSLYYNKSLIHSYYAFAKNMTPQELKDHIEKKKQLTTLNIVIVVLCTIIILENLLVLIAVCRNKKFHSAMFFFIGNLAFSDLLAGSAYIANIFLSGSRTFDLMPIQWFIREGTAFIALAASVFSLLAIAVERYIAITKVKVYGSTKTCRMFLLIGACWVTSILLGGLPIIGWNCINNLPECSAVLPLYSKKYILFVVTIFSIILLSIVILYCEDLFDCTLQPPGSDQLSGLCPFENCHYCAGSLHHVLAARFYHPAPRFILQNCILPYSLQSRYIFWLCHSELSA
ncbi:Sphingosine 1-phosphate receptor 2 [Larimichthys crocea]|uniref:Uncharacterized protein n=1 Tax=Larimichthys crocea TaxID=215358 RepID=A0ACD3R8C3_LARCR|nr:Sphingosine 1-phosphate receptor 2 [Larimichthys crocea]